MTHTTDLYIGDLSNGNYLYINSSGHLTLVGDATVWDDLRVPVYQTKLGGTKDPDFVKVLDDGAGSQGVFAYLFDKTTEEELYFAVQLPHAWKAGSSITPHVHWMPTDTDTGSVVWGIEYSWASINGTFGNTTLVTKTDAADGTADKHQMAVFSAISGTGHTASSMIICRVYRKAADAADTYNADAALIEVDFHYEVDKIGDNSLP
ncbi:MAG: hypothetical protein GWO10_16320 [candidate division Zixibacteria bacterium]|nr:hypothetical protein [Gammaproteobacteria bacterium]NIR25698.1 hypothetical protein [Gammaproteobacteria bacterium]NIR65291.1 hypothetical protein [candidate division Zixibacteria bacterium]NIS52335.1 hypothetical protein [Phycisphaerae bacterium]NIX02134.1 hypothetical protein [Phycisphaerae bacterium]